MINVRPGKGLEGQEGQIVALKGWLISSESYASSPACLFLLLRVKLKRSMLNVLKQVLGEILKGSETLLGFTFVTNGCVTILSQLSGHPFGTLSLHPDCRTLRV